MEASGAEHMAIDSWLLDQHAKGLQPSSLRLYTWKAPTLSLGYHQRQFPDHWNNLHYRGQLVEIVRRPTGGRAVLHQGDLTYAIVTSGLNGSRREVYRQLCQFLIEGWQSLGIELSLGKGGRDYSKSPNCFGMATSADLVMNDGYKLIGSAQVYREGCVLQHGSIRLQPDSDLFETVFGERLIRTTLADTGSKNYELSRIVEALTKSASEHFQVEFETQRLNDAKIKGAMTTHLLTL